MKFEDWDRFVEGARFLLNNQSDPRFQPMKNSINERELNGDTLLMIASSHGHLESVRVILDWGAATDTQNEKGVTALIFAAGNKHAEVVELLLSRGADPNIKMPSGISALWAAKNGLGLNIVKRFKIINMLRHAGAVE